MESQRGFVFVLSAPAVLVLAGCGGTAIAGPGSSGGGGSVNDAGTASGGRTRGTGGALPSTGGVGSSTGGAPAQLADCQNPIAAMTACSEPSAHCGGPCSNSWQADYVCKNGAWELAGVAPCGPNASNAPQCKNSFSGGSLTPCCPDSQLSCAGKPDGYPGFGCTPGDGSFCSCTCYAGAQTCAC